LTIICILNTTNNKIFSQNYLSLFGSNSTTWDIVLQGYCDALCSQTSVVKGDTTIDTHTYKIISNLTGFVREDTLKGKAWFYDTYNKTEYLVMDLGLKLADNFVIYKNSNEAVAFVVDSVYYLNNKKHVRLNAQTTMCSLNEKITFIEGSGTTAGFTYHRNLNGNSVSSSMLCHHKNGTKVMGNVLFNNVCTSCSIDITENLLPLKINFFPNPIQDELNIEIKNFISRNYNLIIYNLMGNKVFSQNLTESLTTIKVSNLNDGIYQAVIEDRYTNEHFRFIKY